MVQKRNTISSWVLIINSKMSLILKLLTAYAWGRILTTA